MNLFSPDRLIDIIGILLVIAIVFLPQDYMGLSIISAFILSILVALFNNKK